MARRTRVLLSVFACEPNRGSEPGIGWNLAVALAKENDVWAVTDIRHRPAIEAFLKKESIPCLSIKYHTIPFGLQINKIKRGKKLLVEFYYYLWQVTLFLTARKICNTEKIEITQHGNFARYWVPSSLAFLNRPFIWGPVGAGDSCPPALFSTLSNRGKVYEWVRNLVRKYADIDPLVRLTAKRSAVALGSTLETVEKIKRLGACHTILMTDVSLNDEEIQQLNALALTSEKPFRLISISRLVEWKGVHLAIRAFAKARIANAEYWIIGEGPDRPFLEQVAENEHIKSQIHFLGNLPRDQVFQYIGASHVLVHSSLHDSGGMVCVEAMAAGRPVICLDIGGPQVIVSEDCGVRIPIHSSEQVIDDLAAAMHHLASDPGICRAMGQAGKKRVISEFNWKNHANLLSAIYRNVLNGASVGS